MGFSVSDDVARQAVADAFGEKATAALERAGILNFVNSPRVGEDHRNGADVTPEQFKETFGFRGGQFGNTMPQSERQSNLNEAYDALMDMAGVLGIPPKALSLNGELGLAFGARGIGGKGAPSAHYEPDATGKVTDNRVVINLTRARGAGAIGHEWFHAADNYFARMRGEKAGYVTEKPHPMGEGVRPEMVEAFKGIMQAVNAAGMRERSKKLDRTRAKAYWSTGREMAARSFESYVVAKLQDQGASNEYLANIVSQDYWDAAAALGMEKEGTYPYPAAAEIPAIRAAFDNFFQTVETKETDTGTAIYSVAESAVPESEWMSEAAIAQVVEETVGQFATEIPVRVIDRESVVFPDAAGADAGVVSGFVHKGTIHLVREGLADRPAVVRTFWHELLHFGLRRFLTKEQYNAELGKLYARDAWIRQRADAWIASDEAATLRRRGESGGYIRARGVDEALADLAEINQGEYRNNSLLAHAYRAVARWVADLAQRFGFADAAARWRGVSNDEARALIRDTFAGLREGREGVSGDWAISADAAFARAREADPNKSVKQAYVEAPGLFPETMPDAIRKEILSWDVVSKSPYSDSFYDITNKSWDDDPDTFLRVADHWNFSTGDGRTHAVTDVPVREGHWTLARHHPDGGYTVLKSVPEITAPDVLQANRRARRSALNVEFADRSRRFLNSIQRKNGSYPAAYTRVLNAFLDGKPHARSDLASGIGSKAERDAIDALLRHAVILPVMR